MYAEVGRSSGRGLVVRVSGEAFCRTVSWLWDRVLIMARHTSFGVLSFAGKIEKTGANADLSIIAMTIMACIQKA